MKNPKYKRGDVFIDQDKDKVFIREVYRNLYTDEIVYRTSVVGSVSGDIDLVDE